MKRFVFIGPIRPRLRSPITRKKSILTFSLALVFIMVATIAYAGPSVKLFVNGQEITPDVPPEVVNGRTMVPVRWVAEALGAKVDWDPISQTVKVWNDKLIFAENKAGRLQAALEEIAAPRTPEEAALTWAQGIEARNAGIQYAVMSPELRQHYAPIFDRIYWCTGVSSPWVKTYRVVSKEEQTEELCTLEISFDFMASTGPAGSYTARLSVEKQDGQEKWHITKIDCPFESAYRQPS